MASINCLFADCLKFFELFCIFSPSPRLSLTKERSNQFRNDFSVNLLLKANNF